MLMPAESCAASPTTSLRLGCGWTFVPISQAEALRNRARAASAISSPAWWPRMWTPKTSPESASDTSFTKPSVSSWMSAMALPRNEKRCVFTLPPPSLPRSSARPTAATWGGGGPRGGGAGAEGGPADDVAHGEDAGLGRAVAAVHLDAGIFNLHVGVFEAHTVRLAAAADRDQDPLRSPRLLTPGLLDRP